MNAYRVSPANRRIILLAVMSLIASLLTINFNAPEASAAAETISFGSASQSVDENVGGVLNVPVTLNYTTSLAGDVTATVAVSGTAEAGVDYTVSGTDIEFLLINTPANGATDDVVVTLGADDNIYEGPETIVLTLTAEVGATIVAEAVHTITINDNEAQPTISVAATMSVGEAGPNAAVLVSKSGVDTEAPITFSYGTTDTGSASAGTDYTTTNGSDGSIATDGTSDTINVPITNDAFDEVNETFRFTISAPSSNATISNAQNEVTINDNDTASIVVTPTSLTVTEGAAGLTYNIRLTSEPTDPVTIGVSNTTGEATASTASVVLNAGNYIAGLDVTVTANNDLIADGQTADTIVNAAATSSDTSYNTVNPDDVAITVNDNDAAGITVSETGVAAIEGGTDGTYTVVLDSEPTDDVKVTLTADTGQATAESTLTALDELTFTALDWFTPQAVTVSALDDQIDDDGSNDNISHLAASTGDSVYNALGDFADVVVTITDNDDAGVTIAPTDVSTTEGQPGTTYDVVLDSQPIDAVTVTLGDTGDFNAARTIGGGQVLTFTTGNWDTSQEVTVTAIDDAIVENDEFGTITHTAGSATDPNYTGGLSIASVSVTIIDDESPNISLGTAPTAVEGGADGTYTVELTQQPSGTVTVTLSITSGGGEFSIVSPTTLTFNAGNYNVGQTVTVRAVDDNVIDGNLAGMINHSAAGGGYTGVTDQEISVTIEDDDVAGVTITQSGGTTLVVEGGATDTYTVVLDAMPTANVTVTAIPDAQVDVTPLTRVFEPGNWNVPQTFTVAGIPDGVDELPTHSGSVQHVTSSSDLDFHGRAVPTLIVSITDVDDLIVTIDGPTVGAPGVTSTFDAMVNAGGTGTITYQWTAYLGGDPVDSGTSASFNFTPAQGGIYLIEAIVGDSQGQNPAVFIQFRVLGDIGTSIFVNDIIWLAEEGITRGCNPPLNTEYCPTQFVTREQMAAFLVRFLGLTDDGGGNTFVDDNTSIFEDDIAKLAAAGITRGCNPPANTNFCPTARVTREQMAAFLVRALNLTDNGGGNTFVDDDASIFQEEIARLAAAGITRGCNPPANTNFCPTQSVTRGQMAAFLRRADAIVNP